MSAEREEQLFLEEQIYINGIDGSTGKPLLPQIDGKPMLGKDLLRFVGGYGDSDLNDLLGERNKRGEGSFGVKYGVDAKDLAKAGWGVIYGPEISDEVKEALLPLVKLRQSQTNGLFKEYAYESGETMFDFLIRNDTALAGVADPEEMPYYLLLVGSPEKMPFVFQYGLDVDRAVGRLHFETTREYDNYARSVVAAEAGEVKLPRRATFFSVNNPNDKATSHSTNMLMKPLYQDFKQERSDKWLMDNYSGEGKATKSQLTTLLGGDREQVPAFLFTGSHGISFPRNDSRLEAHQGALVCNDWDGQPGPIPADVYMAGEHIASDAQLHGMVAFFFACYGAGVPKEDEFMQKVSGTPKQIAPYPFISRLPQRILGHPQGGALAVIGHVERAWTYSFKWGDNKHLSVFEETLSKLFDGYPVGDAFDAFGGKHASVSASLTMLLEKQRRRQKVNRFELIKLWMVNNDARDYIILGDPAVCLAVSKSNKAINPNLQLAPIEVATFQPEAVLKSVEMTFSPEEAENEAVPENAADVPDEEWIDDEGVAEDGTVTFEIELPDDSGESFGKGAFRRVARIKVGVGQRGKVRRMSGVSSGPVRRPRFNMTSGHNYDIGESMPIGESMAIGESMSIGESMAIGGKEAAEMRGAITQKLREFTKQIELALRDLSTLEVTTYVSDGDLRDVYDVKTKSFTDQSQLKAVTLVSLDGDIKNLIATPPAGAEGGEDAEQPVGEQDSLQMHLNTLALAQENRTAFFMGLTEMALTLVNARL